MVKTFAWKPENISAGRKETAHLANWLLRDACGLAISSPPPCSPLLGDTHEAGKPLLRRRPWIYDAEASATKHGLFLSGLEATAVLWDLRRGWNSWLLSVTGENWTWAAAGKFSACICVYDMTTWSPVTQFCSTWSSSNLHDLYKVNAGTCLALNDEWRDRGMKE